MGCGHFKSSGGKSEAMKIGITGSMSDAGGLSNYEGWLLRFNPSIHFVKLQSADEVLSCDGLLLSGGGDIHPGAYGGNESGGRIAGVDEKRDKLEFEVVEKALGAGIPQLGICRGLQTVNVFLGGSLHEDLEAAGFLPHGKDGEKDRRHELVIEEGTMLAAIAGEKKGVVNSSHHQGIDKVGRGLKVSATSADGVAEAVEWETKADKPFLLLVQWHPERMRDSSNPLAESVARTFLKETRRQENRR